MISLSLKCSELNGEENHGCSNASCFILVTILIFPSILFYFCYNVTSVLFFSFTPYWPLFSLGIALSSLDALTPTSPFLLWTRCIVLNYADTHIISYLVFFFFFFFRMRKMVKLVAAPMLPLDGLCAYSVQVYSWFTAASPAIDWFKNDPSWLWCDSEFYLGKLSGS